MESESVSEKGRPPFISGSHFSFFSLFLGTYLFTWNTTLSLWKGVFTKYWKNWKSIDNNVYFAFVTYIFFAFIFHLCNSKLFYRPDFGSLKQNSSSKLKFEKFEILASPMILIETRWSKAHKSGKMFWTEQSFTLYWYFGIISDFRFSNCELWVRVSFQTLTPRPVLKSFSVDSKRWFFKEIELKKRWQIDRILEWFFCLKRYVTLCLQIVFSCYHYLFPRH